MARPVLTKRQQFARTDAIGRLLAFAFALSVLAGPLAVSFFVTPEDIDSGRVALSAPCDVKRALGFECPSCGLTRAFSALSHGRPSDSLGYNRAAPLVYGAFWLGALVSLGLFARAASDLRRVRLPQSASSERMVGYTTTTPKSV